MVRFRRGLTAAALGLTFSCLAAPGASAQDAPEDLPEGPGRDATFHTCSACHSFWLVSQQNLPRRRWDQLLDWMVEEQGMPELPADERELILGYLTTHYGYE